MASARALKRQPLKRIPDDLEERGKKVGTLLRGTLSAYEEGILYAQDILDGTVTGVIDHGALSGLADDDHSQYWLLIGRSGGTTAYGGTDAADAANILSSTGATNPARIQITSTPAIIFDLPAGSVDPLALSLGLVSGTLTGTSLTVALNSTGGNPSSITVSNASGSAATVPSRIIAHATQSADLFRTLASNGTTVLSALTSAGNYQLVVGAGVGKVLVSDASGIASWSTSGAGAVFPDDAFQVVGSADATKTLRFELDAATAGADLVLDYRSAADRSLIWVLAGAAGNDLTFSTTLTGDRVWTIQDTTDTFVGRNTTDILTNKTIGVTNTVELLDQNFLLQNTSDTTKHVYFDLTQMGTGVVEQIDIPPYANGGSIMVLTGAGDVGTAGQILVSGGAGAYPAWTAATTAVDVARTWSTLQTFKDTTILIGDDGDVSKAFVWSLAGATTAKTLTLVSSHTDNRSVTLPDATTTLAGLSVIQSWTALQTFTDATWKLTGSADATKTAVFELDGSTANADLTIDLRTAVDRSLIWNLSGATGGNLTITWPGTASRTWTIPNASPGSAFTFVATGATQTLSNKTLDPDTTSAFLTDSQLRILVPAAPTDYVGFNAVNLGAGTGASSWSMYATVAHDWRSPDYTGSQVIVGNTTTAAGTLGITDLTGQNGSLGAQTLLTSSANSSGLFRISFFVKTTTNFLAATMTVRVAFNDGTAQTHDVLLTQLVNGTGAPTINHDLGTANLATFGSVVVYSAASNAITYTTTVTAGGAIGYTIRARIEAL